MALIAALRLAGVAGAQIGGAPAADTSRADTTRAAQAESTRPALTDSTRPALTDSTATVSFDSVAAGVAAGTGDASATHPDSAEWTGPFAVAPPRSAPFGSPLDRTAWVSWTPRNAALALPRFQYATDIFGPDEPSLLTYPIDARAVAVSVDPAAGTVRTELSAADVSLSPARDVPFEDYARELSSQSLRRAWISESRRRIDNKPADLGTGPTAGGLKVALPFELPTAATSILGRGGPSLNVSGSERISIAGTSNWDNRISGTGVKRSLFPQLDMRQDLDIRLDGSLGDKVSVDVMQNSANTIPLSNRIGIHYQGYEDEVLKNVDLGNTNLSLPGTQYVSYSGRNEGLFGVKAAARLGGTDMALIASKQEGRSERKSYQGTAQEVVRQVDDLNYIKGKYFFLQRPAEQIQTNSRVEIGTVKVFVDDKNGNNNQGVRAGWGEIDPTQPAGESPRVPGDFEALRELTDYEITFSYYGERFPVLVLKNSLANSQVLAVTYDEVLQNGTRRTVGFVPACGSDPNVPCDSMRVKLLQAPSIMYPAAGANQDFYETDPSVAPFVIVRDYELRSFYDLQSANIDPKSLQIQVRSYDAAQEDAMDAYREGNQLFGYLQILGVDLFRDNGSGAALEGPDLIVDQFTNAYFLDPERGILFFPDIRPFDPRIASRPDARPEEDFFFKPRLANTDQTIPGLRRRILWPKGASNPPGVEGGGITPVKLESNPNVYDKRNVQLIQDRKYYIYARFSGSDYSGTISLGQTGLLEGSEVLSIEGVPLERNKDYSIDYDAGIVTLLTARARENRARLTIDYSFAPLFSQAGKTLVGSAFGYRGFEKNFGGAFIYESKGQQELRPRLGEEPTRTFIGDLYTQFSLKPTFLTRIADQLPLYATTEPSRVDVNAEMGMSLPNPNTQNTVYIDDFEGNRDSFSASINRLAWKWPSPPLVLTGALTDTVDADYTEVVWYNPFNTVRANELNPRLAQNEGGENFISVLDLYVPRAPAARPHPASLWTGITTTVEPDGADFSRMQYLELWINDWRSPDVRSNPNLKLHVDLGIVSEDAQRAPGVPPNGFLDSEDKNKDGKFDPSDNPDLREDTGADGVANERETDHYDLSTSYAQDPHGDNYRLSPVNLADDSQPMQRLDPVNYIGPTLTEKSKGTYENGTRLFTEDLNGDQSIDFVNSYVTYTLPLGNEDALRPYLIFAAESTLTLGGQPVAPNNGWKRYRIPLDVNDAAVRTVVNSGSLATVRHLRFWLEGIESFQGDAAPPKTSETANGRQPLLEIAAVDVVGNRWRITALDTATIEANGSVVARNVNNQEDRNIYSPPFALESTDQLGGNSANQREQSIAIEVTRLAVGSQANIFKDQSLPEDYTRYGSLSFYVTPFGFQDSDSARFILRMGYDDRNYYEYSQPIRNAPAAPFLPTPWKPVVLQLTDFTNLKIDRAPGSVADSMDLGNERFKVVGSPTFTRIQRLSLGVTSDRIVADSSVAWRSANTYSGQVWIDDLRAIDVERTPGIANRVTLNAKVADLISFTTNWDRTDENFQRLGQTTGSNINSNRLAFSGSFYPHKFVTTTGIALPLSFSYSKATSTPRLRTGTDIFLQGANAESEKSTAVDRSFSIGFSKTGDRNPILKNTIGRVSLNYSFADRVARTPTQADSSRTLSGGVGYSIAPAEWFQVPVPILHTRAKGRHKIQILPQSASIAFNMTTTRSFLYKRALEDLNGAYALQSDIYRKTAAYQLGASWRPLPFGTYSVTAVRNAAIPGIPPDRILGINVGTMTNFTQRLDGRITIPAHTFVRPTIDFATSYTEARTPDLSPDLSLGQFGNSTNAGFSWEIPLTRLAGAVRPASTTQTAPAQPPPPPPTPPTPMPRMTPGDTTGTDSTHAGMPGGPPLGPGQVPPMGPGQVPPSGPGQVPGQVPPMGPGQVPGAGPGARPGGGPPMPPTPTPHGGFSIPVGRTLSRLGNVSLRATFSRTTGFSRYSGVPSVPYRLGIVRDPDTQWNGDEVQSIFRGPQATDNAQRTYSGDASTTIALVGRSTVRARLNYTNTNRGYNTQVSNSENFTFPDFSFEWGSVARLLRLQGMFTALNAQTRWNTVRTTEGVSLSNPASRQWSQNFSPLLSLSGQTRGQSQILFSIDRRNSKREDLGSRVAVRREGQTTFRTSVSRSYMPGQKVPLFGGTKSTLTLQADATYDKRTGSTEAFGTSSSRINTDNMNLNTSGTYAFSTYVNGTLGLGFSQARDLQIRNVEGKPLVTRSLRLEMTAAIRF